jgi:hypothetical protein
LLTLFKTKKLKTIVKLWHICCTSCVRTILMP